MLQFLAVYGFFFFYFEKFSCVDISEIKNMLPHIEMQRNLNLQNIFPLHMSIIFVELSFLMLLGGMNHQISEDTLRNNIEI